MSSGPSPFFSRALIRFFLAFFSASVSVVFGPRNSGLSCTVLTRGVCCLLGRAIFGYLSPGVCCRRCRFCHVPIRDRESALDFARAHVAPLLAGVVARGDFRHPAALVRGTVALQNPGVIYLGDDVLCRGRCTGKIALLLGAIVRPGCAQKDLVLAVPGFESIDRPGNTPWGRSGCPASPDPFQKSG